MAPDLTATAIGKRDIRVDTSESRPCHQFHTCSCSLLVMVPQLWPAMCTVTHQLASQA